MKLQGWCETCRRVRLVNVTGSGLARAGRGVVTGECDACRDAAEAERRARGRR